MEEKVLQMVAGDEPEIESWGMKSTRNERARFVQC
jgi:hypothetical protein